MEIVKLCLGPVQTNCYIAMEKEMGKAFLVDPADKADRIKSKLEESQVCPEAILLTHGHFDHGMAAEELSKYYQIPIYVGEKEKELIENPNLNASDLISGIEYCLKPDYLLADGAILSLCNCKIKVLATPGHTKGGVCYYLPEQQICFSGDTLFCGGIGRWDLPTGDYLTLIQSIREQLFLLPPETVLLPGHGKNSTIEEERKTNPYFLEDAFWD